MHNQSSGSAEAAHADKPRKLDAECRIQEDTSVAELSETPDHGTQTNVSPDTQASHSDTALAETPQRGDRRVPLRLKSRKRARPKRRPMVLADKDRPRFVNLPPPQINRAVVSDVTHWTKGKMLGGTKQFDNVPTTDVGKALRDLISREHPPADVLRLINGLV